MVLYSGLYEREGHRVLLGSHVHRVLQEGPLEQFRSQFVQSLEEGLSLGILIRGVYEGQISKVCFSCSPQDA